tara:strand:+ start:4344 stop:4457 length:114 start_codon:yes stop_codon:yes gene_type:complete
LDPLGGVRSRRKKDCLKDLAIHEPVPVFEWMRFANIE